MNNLKYILLPFVFLVKFGLSQTDSLSLQYKVDTLETHFYNLTWQSSGGKLTYYKNGKKISKSHYEALNKKTIDPNKCKPCYLIAYQDNTLIYEGDFYTDCGVGLYIEYHPNGIVKSKGDYKRNSEQNWDTDKVDDWCAIKNGKWEYYDEKGIQIKSEQYEYGILVK